MERARLRALTLIAYVLISIFNLPCRNGESPIKGIDTMLPDIYESARNYGRNGESPIKGIDTSFIGGKLSRPQFAVEMERARLRALTRVAVSLIFIFQTLP